MICLQNRAERGKLLTVQGGYLVCPTCKRNRKVQRIDPETEAHRLPVYCKDCKARHIVDIFEGQCFESRGQ